ncbi:MAG: twin-arginine translocation signal domain-containing protein, partial [Rhodospirillales bacterium]|nr:twin-arginine translocation signal domain-containing protein [Acetobacter sp.]
MSANKHGSPRRDFLKTLTTAAPAVAATAALGAEQQSAQPHPRERIPTDETRASEISYPRIFSGPALAMISFPLGGIGAGSLGLGGRGQLRDWEIFNRPGKGEGLMYAFPSIWLQAEGEKPVAHVLEARIETPYEGPDGLGSNNVPGLSRLQGATFSGEFPRAHIDFHDDRLPVTISLDAGTPFVPLDADTSGLPLAALHYRVRNRSRKPVLASIAFSLENPVRSPKAPKSDDAARKNAEDRKNEWRRGSTIEGLWMTNSALAKDSPDFGSFVLAVLKDRDSSGKITGLTGWPAGRWWNSPLLFWDDFSDDGELGPEPDEKSAVGAVCLKRTIAPGTEERFSFLLAWHFPNRTPERCGWEAPKGHEGSIIGNWYSAKYADAWAVASAAADELPRWEERTAAFTRSIRESTIPAPVKDAAMSNLSTLVSTTCFRTADGEFHAFEGVNDTLGCCFGNCTHVWNYETATAYLFPS